METLSPEEVSSITNNRLRTESSWKDVYKTLVSDGKVMLYLSIGNYMNFLQDFPYLIYGADQIKNLNDILSSLQKIGFTNVSSNNNPITRNFSMYTIASNHACTK